MLNLQKFLSIYYPTNVASGEAQKIVTEIKEAGINPGKGLAEAMAAEGFDAKAVGDASKPEGDRPPPSNGEGGPNGKVNSAAISLLSDIIDSFSDEEMTSENWASVLARLEENGVNLFDSKVDVQG